MNNLFDVITFYSIIYEKHKSAEIRALKNRIDSTSVRLSIGQGLFLRKGADCEKNLMVDFFYT